jgi:hypothetical protein
MSGAMGKAEDERKPEPTALTIVEPIAPLEKIVGSMKAFEELKSKLLIEDDWQLIQGKRYIKRSGFRKIALAFGLSDKILEHERVDRPNGSFIWRIRVKVWAKNERSAEGVGACDSEERNFAHLEHDVYATAHTRAKSRAISDLVAGGAVSAEEVSSEPHGEDRPREQGEAARVCDAPGTRPAEGARAGPATSRGQSFGSSLQALFPKDLADRLTFEEGEEWVIVRPKQWLSPESFNEVLAAVKGYGGKYVSAGDQSHFAIPKPEA